MSCSSLHSGCFVCRLIILHASARTGELHPQLPQALVLRSGPFTKVCDCDAESQSLDIVLASPEVSDFALRTGLVQSRVGSVSPFGGSRGKLARSWRPWHLGLPGCSSTPRGISLWKTLPVVACSNWFASRSLGQLEVGLVLTYHNVLWAWWWMGSPSIKTQHFGHQLFCC